jgi:hypothetical protein
MADAYAQQGPHVLHWNTPSVALTALQNVVAASSCCGVPPAEVVNDLTSSASGWSWIFRMASS